MPKPVAEFYEHRADCKICHRAVMRKGSARHYAANKDYYRKRNSAQAKRITNYIRAAKIAKLCADCKLSHPYWRLDFDHLDGAKKTAVLSSSRVRFWGLERVKLEMAKCELVCANCHRDRTQRRRNSRGR